MNFTQLQYVIAVKRYGHFGKAADACHVTQATLSGMIKKLEEELNYVLFDRSSHPIQPTEKGIALIEKANKILELQGDLFKLKSSDGELSGEVDMGIIPTISNTLLPLMLPEFMREHPSLTLNLVEATTEEIVRKLRTQELDFGILSSPLPQKLKLPYLEILYYESMMVYGVSEQKENFNPHDLNQENVWLLEDGHCFRNQSMAICAIENELNETAQLNFKSNSFLTLINLCDQLGGYTLIPELYCSQLEPSKKARSRSFSKPIPVREVSLVANSSLLKQDVIKTMSEHIKAIVPPLLSTAELSDHDLDIIAM